MEHGEKQSLSKYFAQVYRSNVQTSKYYRFVTILKSPTVLWKRAVVIRHLFLTKIKVVLQFSRKLQREWEKYFPADVHDVLTEK